MGKLFFVEKATKGREHDFEVYVIGDFDFLPEWWSRALECVFSWWDGAQGDDAGNQVHYRLASDLTPEQRASVKRLLRRVAKEGRRATPRMPQFRAAELARCNRAFAA